MSKEVSESNISTHQKLSTIYSVAAYRPLLAGGIICLSVFTAILEGLGLSFLIPVIEIAQGTASADEISGVGRAFVSAYRTIGVPFTLETVIGGAAIVMLARYTSSFLIAWLRAALGTDYVRHLQTKGFEHSLAARIGYYDEHGSDEVLNAIVTQAEYASSTIRSGIRVVEQGLLSLMYLAVTLYLAPFMTILTGVILGGVLYGFRRSIESGYEVGDRVAEANERVQETVQAGTQGIREVKLFGLQSDLLSEFYNTVDQFARSQIKLRRNQAMLENGYRMVTAVTVFGLIYVAIRVLSLPLASLGVFLFAMFRLAPRVSTLNNVIYKLEGDLPHLVRTQQFVNELKAREEPDVGDLSPPNPVETVTLEGVDFSYGDDKLLDSVTFTVRRGQFVGFAGPSGAGKSTIVALVARMYDVDSGQITADGTPIEDYNLAEWRGRLSVVRQNPFIFNDTLRHNIKIGNHDASESDVERVCDLSQVSEFLDGLPQGLDTRLGDDGVRLSGGQRQRVALARALLKDADFLVLDEATSDLDSNIEEDVHSAIERMKPDLGMLVIAHRLQTIQNADVINVMDDGRITESGTHEELLGENGLYASLWTTQTKEA